MKKILMILGILAIFCLAIYVAVYFLLVKDDSGNEKLYKTIVSSRDIQQVVRGNGIVTSHEQVDIVTKLPGRIKDFNIDVGQSIEEEQVLFHVENEDIENEYNLAKAEYDKAKAELDKLKAQPDPARVLEAENTLSKAEVAYKEAKNAVELKEKLYKEGFVSQKEFDDLVNKNKFANNEFELAKKRYEEVDKPPTEQEIALAEAKLIKQETQLETVKEKVDGREVLAPITGTVVDKKIDESLLDRDEEIPAGTSIITIANLKENLFVNGEIYESDVQSVSVGQEVQIIFSQQNKPFRGKITELSLMAKAYGTVRKFPIEIEIIDDVSSFVKLGMRVDFMIVVERKEKVLALPLTYIHSTESGKGVWIKENESLVFVPVITGLYNEQIIEIVSGLSENQEVFLNPSGKMQAVKKRAIRSSQSRNKKGHPKPIKSN